MKFTITGNQESPTGNAIPKLRLTQNQYWKPSVKRYFAWKDHVVRTYIESLGTVKEKRNAARNIALTSENKKIGKPIVTDKDQKVRMDIMIYWSTHANADPESVFGSIADALFLNDKMLSGSFDFGYCPEKRGRVEVVINNL